ncbi:MAG TPA: FAD:protein FMN transferase [Clostridia bacterium]
MKKISFALTLIIILSCMALFSSCSKTLKSVDFGPTGTWVFGTPQTGMIVITGTLYGYNLNTLKNARDEIVTTLKSMNEELNTVDRKSVIYQFNNYGADDNFDPAKKFYISEYLYHMLTVAKEFRSNANGMLTIDGEEFNVNEYFNPAIYPLMELWELDSTNIHDETQRTSVPSTEQIEQCLPYTDFEKVHFGKDENGYYMTKDIKEIKLDFGGQAKGYGTDLAVEICKKYNIKGAFFNIGGNVFVYKQKPLDDGTTQKWNAGITMPIQHQQSAFCALKLENTSVVTSGDYNRYFMFNGVKYAHILNPFNGLPVNITRDEEGNDSYNQSGLISVTIIDQNSELSDIYAKIVMLLGMENGVKYMNQNNLSGVLISNDKRFAAVGKLEQYDSYGALGYQDYTAYVDAGGVEYSFK